MAGRQEYGTSADEYNACERGRGSCGTGVTNRLVPHVVLGEVLFERSEISEIGHE
jgi:hypothetical protein